VLLESAHVVAVLRTFAMPVLAIHCVLTYIVTCESLQLLQQEVPHINLPQHMVTELVPTPFGTNARHISEAEMQDCF
jgi:hypothetical protein